MEGQTDRVEGETVLMETESNAKDVLSRVSLLLRNVVDKVVADDRSGIRTKLLYKVCEMPEEDVELLLRVCVRMSPDYFLSKRAVKRADVGEQNG